MSHAEKSLSKVKFIQLEENSGFQMTNRRNHEDTTLMYDVELVINQSRTIRCFKFSFWL